MSDILNAKGSGAILLAILLVVVIVYSLITKNKKVDDVPENNIKQECPLDLNDFDATLACLIASIELRNETHSNVKVLNVRRIG